MKDILQTIVAYKREEIRQRKEAMPLPALRERVETQEERKSYSMRQALETSPTGIIAEFKRKSPSKGWLHPDAKVDEVLPAYAKNGASACSILTDAPFFGGTPADLREARRQVDLPLLRKDFLLDEYQLYEARLFGADAVLLIASILSPAECRSLAEKAHALGLETLLEIHREEELAYLNPEIDMLGVNNRNLGTFHTDIANAKGIIPAIHSYLDRVRLTPLVIAESGIREPSSVKQLRDIGYRGFLIGETFMKEESPGVALGKFVQEMNL